MSFYWKKLCAMVNKMSRTVNREKLQELLLLTCTSPATMLAVSLLATAFHQLAPHHQVRMDKQMSLCVVALHESASWVQ